MLRLLVGKLSPPPSAAIRRLPVGIPLAADQSFPTPEPTASSRRSSSSSTSDSPLTILKSYGVSEEQAFTILAKYPALRNYDTKDNLKPKLDFLLNAGLTGAEMAEVLTANPQILSTNLERTIAPCVHFLKTILPSKDSMIRVLRYTTITTTMNLEANVKVLKGHGVPEVVITSLLRYQPRALVRRKEDFEAAVDRVKELGLVPTTSTFVMAVAILAYMTRSSFQRKVAYRELGWSEEAVYAMFKKYPQCMGISDENIRVKMEFFMEKLGWSLEAVAANLCCWVIALKGGSSRVVRCSTCSWRRVC